MGNIHIRSCYFCEHLGKENVGEGVNPICNYKLSTDEQDCEYSRPAISDFTNCPHFVCKESNDTKLIVKYKDGTEEEICTVEPGEELNVYIKVSETL